MFFQTPIGSANRTKLTVLFVSAVVASGCTPIKNESGGAGMVFAATEVGTPKGDKITKQIGSEGGSLVSPDGRMALTVPKNALTETIAFSIQPITNTSANGLGLAYRLEPSGREFITPLELSVRYNDGDLAGTVPEALSIAYQDPEGAWHAEGQTVLDPQAKTVTASVTHFTDWSFLTKLRISPDKATIRVGETVKMQLTPCHHQTNFANRVKRFLGGVAICELTNGTYNFNLQPNWFADVGTIDKPREIHVIYTAPPSKPSPNVATITIPFEFESRGDSYSPPRRGMLVAHVTIRDPGYRATGSDGPTIYTGVVCDLAKPFEVTGNHPLYTFPYKFVPSSPTAGTASYQASWAVTKATGSGSYTIEGADTEAPRILWQSQSTLNSPVGTTSGGGRATINLVPLTGRDKDDCK